MDMRAMTGGAVLEGVGVAPDVVVKPPPLPYSQGLDAIRERGIEVVLEQILEHRRVDRKHGWY